MALKGDYMNTDNNLSNNGQTALVVEGGAMRGIFSTGVLDAFLTQRFNPFDLCIGVSAGATNIAAYLAEMYQRNFKVYTDYSLRPDFISWRKFLTGGHLIDLDWLWAITIREIRLDLDKIFSTPKEYYVGVTEIHSGKAVYLKPEKTNLEDIMKASSSIPIFYRKFLRVNELDCVDGGLADPIPVLEAYRRNAKTIMVIRSRPYSYTKKSESNEFLSKLYFRNYPGLADAIGQRAKAYQEAVVFMRNPPQGIRIIEVNPPESFHTKRLTKDLDLLTLDYQSGFQAGMDIMKQFNRITAS